MRAPPLTLLELIPIVVALIIWGRHWSKARVIFLLCDNEGAVHAINQKRAHDPRVALLIRAIARAALRWDLEIVASHISYEFNIDSDNLSRGRIDAFFIFQSHRFSFSFSYSAGR